MILKNLEQIHEAGYVYNNIRPINVIIDEDTVKLIGFRNCQKYLNNKGKHILNNKKTKMHGNSIIDLII